LLLLLQLLLLLLRLPMLAVEAAAAHVVQEPRDSMVNLYGTCRTQTVQEHCEQLLLVQRSILTD
jgi:hypothetical protein